jgi:hemerythrin-like domain-containing protein
MAKDNLSGLMISHHALIGMLFTLLKEELREKSQTAGSTFSELVWEIKKHFFTEENAIFDYLPLRGVDIFKTINHLRDEHLAMLNILKNFSDNFPKITNEQIEEFSNLLETHREVEEQILYPKLDKEIREEQKEEIISRINEITINGNN